MYIASASEDPWADPRGEFLAAQAASPVYELFGKKGLSDTPMPGPGEAVTGSVSYHLRAGKHDITLFDWEHYLDFADHFLGSR